MQHIKALPVVTGKYTEAFFSVQGEAKNTGKLCTWLRLFSCNLQCRGFGQDEPGNPESWVQRPSSILKAAASLDDVVTPKIGCDSDYSWNAAAKHLAVAADSNVAAGVVRDTIPVGAFTPRIGHVFTGGEPMLQQRFMAAIMEAWMADGNVPAWIGVETNGTQPLGIELAAAVEAYMSAGHEFYFSVSPKLLHVSGERPEKAVNVDVIKSYIDFCPGSYLKFVLNEDDRAWRQAEGIKESLGAPVETWVMPVGAVSSQQLDPAVGRIADKAIFDYGWNVSPRVHVLLWGDDQIGR